MGVSVTAYTVGEEKSPDLYIYIYILIYLTTKLRVRAVTAYLQLVREKKPNMLISQEVLKF